MKTEQLVKQYLRALQNANYDAVMKLFTKDAIVHSPLYGCLKARTFFKELFNDTKSSRLKLLGIFKGKNGIAFLFRYDWTLKNGASVSSETIDIIKLANGRIKELKIIYDASKTRAAVKKLRHG